MMFIVFMRDDNSAIMITTVPVEYPGGPAGKAAVEAAGDAAADALYDALGLPERERRSGFNPGEYSHN